MWNKSIIGGYIYALISSVSLKVLGNGLLVTEGFVIAYVSTTVFS